MLGLLLDQTFLAYPVGCPKELLAPPVFLWGETVDLGAELWMGGGWTCLPCVLTSILPLSLPGLR